MIWAAALPDARVVEVQYKRYNSNGVEDILTPESDDDIEYRWIESPASRSTALCSLLHTCAESRRAYFEHYYAMDFETIHAASGQALTLPPWYFAPGRDTLLVDVSWINPFKDDGYRPLSDLHCMNEVRFFAAPVCWMSHLINTHQDLDFDRLEIIFPIQADQNSPAAFPSELLVPGQVTLEASKYNLQMEISNWEPVWEQYADLLDTLEKFKDMFRRATTPAVGFADVVRGDIRYKFP
ncbi:hypothetical protein BJ878DRAFT_274314 [Calycina marina]|uniref:2EXR domain-containing protein n=1 Tax=Calycina marina TaxID=1763456 RepID=A0A9P8CIK7_9HELO|nr:hypothetical protein BJ878DRAFT_274314 [Calycina marina]